MALSPLEVKDRLSREIKRRRLMLGMTQKRLAHAVNISSGAVCAWEKGISLPNVRMLPNLAEALHVTETELLNPIDTDDNDDYSTIKLDEKVIQEIRRIRLLRGITQEEFAEKVGVAWITIARWESGDGAPEARYLRKFAEVLAVSKEDLLNPSPDAEAPKKYARVERRQGRKKRIMT